MDQIKRDIAEMNRIGYMQVLAERNAAEALLHELTLELEAYRKTEEIINSQLGAARIDADLVKRSGQCKSSIKEKAQDTREYLNKTGRY